MKNTYIIIIVLVVLAGGALLFAGMGNKAQAPILGNTPLTPGSPSSPVACTQEAKLCPDGSAVGRTGPNCEFAACPSVGSTASIKEFTVSAQNFSFSPSTITVKKGDRVKINFVNVSGFHDFKLDEFSVSTKQTNGPSQQSVEFNATKTGSFEYYCSVGNHRAMGMKGTLVVQ